MYVNQYSTKMDDTMLMMMMMLHFKSLKRSVFFMPWVVQKQNTFSMKLKHIFLFSLVNPIKSH